MITPLEFFGGQINQSISSNFTIDFRARVWRISADNGTRTVFYPAVTSANMPVGAIVFIIINSGSFTFTIRDTELVDPTLTLSTTQGALILSYTSAGAKKWIPDRRTYSSY